MSDGVDDGDGGGRGRGGKAFISLVAIAEVGSEWCVQTGEGGAALVA